MTDGIIAIVSMIFAYIGAAIILYGGALTVFKTLKYEIKKSIDLGYSNIRRDFTNKIVFGLDFMIAGDILKTIAAPSQADILFLGATVGIRTVLGYFLTIEANFEAGKK
ncbi:MAG TPA: DUF1622 domain-containing protein [Candidatus Methanoperedens sp.]|nr:DUF1622 domain-containing protein [Candidatus Methanoperedens sp.]HLB71163.1 DUF1622 domain-containing protein [Candidatus Methanoperedens sp.]